MTDNAINPVVVGVDDSTDSLRAAQSAAAVAVDRGLPLHVVHARAWPTYSGAAPLMTYPAPPLESEPQARGIVERVCDAIGKEYPALEVTGHVIDGGPAVVLIDQSRHAELVAVGSHGNGGIAQLLLGSTAMDVAARAACPVLVVRGEAARKGPVVVGIDGKATTKAAIGFAFAEARSRGVPLRAVRAWSHTTEVVATVEEDEQAREKARFVIGEWLGDWRAEFADVVVETATPQEGAARALAEESRGASLVVVGSRMRGPLRARLLGSTGYALIHSSHCPVAIVRPHS